MVPQQGRHAGVVTSSCLCTGNCTADDMPSKSSGAVTYRDIWALWDELVLGDAKYITWPMSSSISILSHHDNQKHMYNFNEPKGHLIGQHELLSGRGMNDRSLA